MNDLSRHPRQHAITLTNRGQCFTLNVLKITLIYVSLHAWVHGAVTYVG